MASSRGLFKAAPSEVQEDVDSIRRELVAVGTSTLCPDDSVAIAKQALALLEAVDHLLQALSPADVEATATRTLPGSLVDGHAGYWRVYGARHRVLSDVFGTQRALFASLVQTYLEQRCTAAVGPQPDGHERKEQP
jgi:hypothetical protein